MGSGGRNAFRSVPFRSVLAVSLLLGVAAVAAGPSAAQESSAARDKQPIVLPARPYAEEEIQRIIASDLEFRQKSGLRADRAHVDALVRAHDYTKSVPKFLIAATPEEDAELELRNTLRAEVGALGKELAELKGSDFGGSYVDPQTGRVVVWSVGNRLSRPEVERRVSHPARLELRHARYSQAQLESVTRDVAGLFVQLQAEGFAVSGVGTDLFTNSVQLLVDADGDQEQLRQRLGKELDPQMFTFIVGLAEPSGDLHGGTDWDPPGVAAAGTKGFDAYQAGTWLIYALTAGHLSVNTVTFAGHTMHRAATLFANNSTTDVAAFHMQPTNLEYWNHNSGYVWHGDPSILIGVSGWDHIGNPYNDQVGAQVCMSGHLPVWRKCGYITMLNRYVTYQHWSFGTRNIWVRQANYPCADGNSGGPVWGWSWPTARAVGTQSGQGFSELESLCWYTHLDNALYPWGLTDVIKYWDS
ncbi:MAG: hypothetical protein ACKV2O_18530 [Acidimicrobiales bacterium]